MKEALSKEIAPSNPLRGGNAREVFAAFLRPGCTSFGGPIAHLSYFRDEFVTRRKWIDDSAYADLVALCQFLPGPASSQAGFTIGLMRAGPMGALAAWTAFTLPSAMLLVAFAYSVPVFEGGAGGRFVHGLKIAAVAVVAHAVFGMAKTLTPDWPRRTIAVLAVAVAACFSGALSQVAAIALGAALGSVLCKAGAVLHSSMDVRLSKRGGAIALAIFLLLPIALPLVASGEPSGALRLFDAFYRSGALVFGGGHVVLPVLRAAVVDPGWVSTELFLSGYGAAQAVPGPLFTFAAYLGAVSSLRPHGIAGAGLALVAIFLPGLLLVTGILPFWAALQRQRLARGAIRGANAAVVGVLAAALYNPLWQSAIGTMADFAIAAIAFFCLAGLRAPPWSVPAGCAAAAYLI